MPTYIVERKYQCLDRLRIVANSKQEALEIADGMLSEDIAAGQPVIDWGTVVKHFRSTARLANQRGTVPEVMEEHIDTGRTSNDRRIPNLSVWPPPRLPH